MASIADNIRSSAGAGTGFSLYRAIQNIYPTHRYGKTRRFEVEIPDDCYKIKVTGCGCGGGTHGGFINGGASGGGVAGAWVEGYELKVYPKEMLYCQIAGGGTPTAAGAPPAQVVATDITYIKRGSHNSGIALLALSGQSNFGMATPTIDRGGQAQLASASSIYNPNINQSAAGAVGANGVSMAQLPTPNTGDMTMLYPPLTPSNFKGNFGTNAGQGGGVNTGVGQSGGRMGRFIGQSRNHFGGTASGSIAGGGAPAIGLPLEKYEPYVRRDAAIEAFVEPNSGANIVVDTPVQKMWGAGGVGAASGHMGGYGGDGVLIIEYITGANASTLHKKILMPCDLIDSVANPSGLAVPSTFLGKHSFASADAIVNGFLFQQVRLSDINGFLQLQVSVGNTFYNNYTGDTIRVDGIGAAGANLTGKITALSKFNGGDTYNTLATTNIPISSVAVALGTQSAYQFRTMPYVPSWNWAVMRSHDGVSDWSKMHVARLSMTTVSGSNVLTFVSSVNGCISDLKSDRVKYAAGDMYQGVALVPLHEISGAGIPVGTRINSIDGSNNITMSANATASATVSVHVYDITKMELYLASPMSAGKRMMFMVSGTPDWLASSNIIATNRTVSGNVVTIGHAAIPTALQVGVKIRVRNCGNAAINGSDETQTTNWTVLSGGSTTSTRFQVPPTANEVTTTDTATEILLFSNEGGYGYMNPPNAAVGDGYAEVATYTTWLMIKYGALIDWIETQNEANSGFFHQNSQNPSGGLNFAQVQQGIWWTGTFDQLGELVRRINVAAKAVKPAVKIGCPSATGISVGQTHYKAVSGSRSNIHLMLSAGDGAGGKLLDWVDYLAIHIYNQSTNRVFNGGTSSLIDTLRYFREFTMMESINKPNMDIIMTEGGFETGIGRDNFQAMPFVWQANEIKKWHVLMAGFGFKGVYPFLDGFMGEPARYPEHEAAYVWIASNVQGKTIHPDSCFNEDTGEMYFKNTDGFSEYIP